MTSTSTNARARQIVDLLKDVPLFAGLDHDDLGRLSLIAGVLSIAIGVVRSNANDVRRFSSGPAFLSGHGLHPARVGRIVAHAFGEAPRSDLEVHLVGQPMRHLYALRLRIGGSLAWAPPTVG